MNAPTLDTGDTAWMLTSTALVLFMSLPGLALFYGGLVRAKNVLSVLAQCFAIAAVVTVQVGTQVSVEQVAQLQKLRALVMAQMQAQDAYMAAQQQQKDAVKAAEETFYTHRDPRQGRSYNFDFSYQH